MAAQSQEATPSEWKSQSQIGKNQRVTAAAVRSPGCYRNSQRSETRVQDCALADLAWEIFTYFAIWAKETTFMTQLLSDFIGDFKYEI